MILTTTPELDSRIKTWSRINKQSPERFIMQAIERSLDDWEDYNDALHICAEVDAGRMKTYSLDDVERHLDALES